MKRRKAVAVEPLLDAGDALIVHVHEADQVRDLRAVRIGALVLVQEADARQAEPVDFLLLLGGDLALEPREAALAVAEPLAHLAWRRGPACTAVSSSTASSTSISRLRLAEQRGRPHVGRQDFAVAVEDVGARGRRRVAADTAGAAGLSGCQRVDDEAALPMTREDRT